MNTKEYDKQSLFTLFATYVSANVLSMMGLSLNVFTDTFFIANGIGPTALAALNLSLPIFALITGIGLMIGMGGATRFAILKASHHNLESNKIFTHALLLAFVASIIFMIAGIFFSRDISSLMGANQETLEMTTIYTATILILAGTFFFNHTLVCFVRNDGAPRLTMIAMLAGNLTNIIFDYIFIYHMNMGLFGAAFATCFSPVVSMIILSTHFVKKKNTFQAIKCKIEMNPLIHICQIGSSSFINELSSGVVMITFNYSLLHYIGNIGISAYSIIANLALVFQAVFTGLAQGIQPLVSHCFGSKDFPSIYKLIKYALVTSLVFGIIFLLTGMLIPDLMVSIFNADGDTILRDIAVNGILLYFPAFLFMGSNIVLSCFFASVNAPKPSLLISLMRGCFLVILFIIVLPQILGVNGIWLSIPSAEIVSAIIAFTILYFFIKKEIKPHIIKTETKQ